jgi:hypothetical protein
VEGAEAGEVTILGEAAVPLLDHFHPPFRHERHWQGFHSLWTGSIVTQLNKELLPKDFVAEPQISLGILVESDVATFEKDGAAGGNGGGLLTAVYAPPRPRLKVPVDWSDLDLFEVKVFHDEGGAKLVAVIELVSPANKDRVATRKAFLRKCASYLQEGVAVMIVDVVTHRTGNFHAALLKSLGHDVETRPRTLYAAAYRTVSRKGETMVEAWPATLRIGKPLPTLPLWLASDIAIPVDLEKSYRVTCESLRIPW